MPTITQHLDAAFRTAIHAAFGLDADPLIGVSQNDKFGDYQSNAAMGLAKLVSDKTGQKTTPRQVAEQIKAKLNLADMATEVSIAGPGFINVKLSPAWLADFARKQATDDRLGIPLAASPTKVVVDYSGPNIAKQMHVGHLRSTIIGDALANVIEAEQHDVTRQSHIGDWGTQFGMLIAYLDAEMLQVSETPLTEPHRPYITEANQVRISDLESFYRAAKKLFDEDPGFAVRARETVVRLQAGSPHELSGWVEIVKETRRHYLPIYDRLHVKLGVDNERGESFYNPFLPDVVRELREKGIAVESEGAVVVKVPGFESPLIIQKSDGGYLYGTTDLAAIRFRVEQLKAKRVIYTHDSRQQQHFAQVFWTAKAAGWADGVSLEFAPFGTMLGADGKPFKTRSGDTVKLKDLLDEAEERGYALAKAKDDERVAKLREKGDADAAPFPEEKLVTIGRAIGVGGVKYADLSKDRTSDYVFSWDTMLALNGNSAPYLQYVYARIRSIFYKAGSQTVDATRLVLDSPYELALAKQAARFGEAVDAVARELKPHVLCTYLYDLASRFSSFYENCPVLQSDEATKASRLALCDLTARVMAKGLDLLGIEHPEQM